MQTLIRQLKHGVEDSHFILLVAQLPSLEKLLIDGLTPYAILDWHHFFSHVGTALQSLKVLTLWGSRLRTDHKAVENSLQILDLLPNLEFLQIAYMSAQGHRHTSKDTPPTRKLRVVAFRESAVRHRLSKKITGSQHLESFLYIPGHDAMVADPSAYFYGRQVASYLESSENSLKFLSSYPMTDLEHTGTRGFANLEHLNVTFSGILPGIDKGEALDVIEDQLRERLPTSLKKLTLNRLLHTPHGGLMAAAVAALKIEGTLPHLDVLVMKFAPPIGMRMVGLPALSLDQIKSLLETQLGPTFSKANLKLEIEESS